MRIGQTELPHGLMLAPLAGFTDHAMRALCHRAGAEYCVTEMVSAKAICYGDRKTPLLSRIYPEDGPCAVQLFGREPEFLAEAAAVVAAGDGGVPPVAIDINMGCPVPKVAGNGEGSALMREPTLVEKIVAAVAARVSLPVTVKIRAGWDDAHRNAPEVARAAEAGGAAAICVHARTRAAMYSGSADPAVIAAVKAAVSVPVIGNGDIRTGADARRLTEATGCDGVMVGRAAVGDPFVFRSILREWEGLPPAPPTPRECYAAAEELLRLRAAEKGEDLAVRESRKQAAAFLRGFPSAAEHRARVCRAVTIPEMLDALAVLLTL